MPNQTQWCGIREIRQDKEDRMNSCAHLPQAPYLFSWTHSLVLEEEIAIHSSILFLPEESHGQRSLVGYSPRGHKGLDTTEWLSTALFGASGKEPPANTRDVRDSGSIPGSEGSPGGGHGNPIQYSCLENLHGQRSLAGHSPWGRKESDTTELT